jgi:membrane protein DedA with SNARE-associated domain
MDILGTASGLLALLSALAFAAITDWGYLGLFLLMVLEGASLPIPSEVMLPLSGYLVKTGVFNFYIAFAVSIIGAVAGAAIDYAIGYYLGKAVVYKHLRLFHVTKRSLDQFDAWFERNKVASIFFARFIPEVRALISFPAGFARMPLKEFFAYSIAGMLVWNMVLMLFGYYLLSAHSAVIVMGSVGVLAIALYAVYKVAMRRIKK